MTPGCSVTPHPRPARDGALTSGRPAGASWDPSPGRLHIGTRPAAPHQAAEGDAPVPALSERCPRLSEAGYFLSERRGLREQGCHMMRFLKVDVGRKAQRSFFQGPTFGRLFVISRDTRAAETVSHPPGKRTARRLRTAGAGAWSAGVGDGAAPGQGLGAVGHRGDAGILANGLAPSIQSAPHTCRADVQHCSVRQFARAIRVRTLEGGGCRERRRKAPVPGR